MREVKADLVVPAGLEIDFDLGRRGEAPPHAPPRDRRLPVAADARVRAGVEDRKAELARLPWAGAPERAPSRSSSPCGRGRDPRGARASRHPSRARWRPRRRDPGDERERPRRPCARERLDERAALAPGDSTDSIAGGLERDQQPLVLVEDLDRHVTTGAAPAGSSTKFRCRTAPRPRCATRCRRAPGSIGTAQIGSRAHVVLEDVAQGLARKPRHRGRLAGAAAAGQPREPNDRDPGFAPIRLPERAEPRGEEGKHLRALQERGSARPSRSPSRTDGASRSSAAARLRDSGSPGPGRRAGGGRAAGRRTGRRD